MGACGRDFVMAHYTRRFQRSGPPLHMSDVIVLQWWLSVARGLPSHWMVTERRGGRSDDRQHPRPMAGQLSAPLSTPSNGETVTRARRLRSQRRSALWGGTGRKARPIATGD
ncbi:hypothetical protein chiPu_0024703 [Chiloscyllium punctatum]|uniref:Uncharacterized protein n=1 Tax=Chiloscyllium punctatum TaxID=137246 RepID=A0A401TDS4_CHIPU|nr:hypothetical protein [Chiloscyllium punctatum]